MLEAPSFDHQRNGYDEIQVDDYVATARREMSRLQDETKWQKEEIERMQEERSEFRGSAENIGRALISAQAEAERIVEEARQRADATYQEIVATHEDKIAHLKDEIEELRQKRESVRADLNSHVEQLRRVIDSLGHSSAPSESADEYAPAQQPAADEAAEDGQDEDTLLARLESSSSNADAGESAFPAY